MPVQTTLSVPTLLPVPSPLIPSPLTAESSGWVVPLGQSRSNSLLLIDGEVQDYQGLIAGAAPGTEVHILTSAQDAVTQITQILLGRNGISSLQIVSHGEAGGLDFGSSRLNLEDLPEYTAQLQSWGQALTDDADLLLYGCNVARGELGQAFVQILSQLTGADVAASTNLTGSSALGGDWILEMNTGTIAAGLAFSAIAVQSYGGVLDAFYASAQQFTGNVTPQKVAVDGAGNVYTTGYFSDTVDFDPGAGTVNLTSPGIPAIFISKLDSNGNYLWARQLGGADVNQGNGIRVDSSGNVYTTGVFNGIVDFDPGAGIANLNGSGGNSFISKLDTNGNYLWAKALGGTGFALADDISLDSAGNIYTTGSFQGTADFDPGASIVNLISAGSPGDNDIFISKLDSSGNYLWAKAVGGVKNDTAFGISVDSSGNVYTTGNFDSTVDFDPGVGVVNLISAGGSGDIFISKLDSSGNYLWAKAVGGTGFDQAASISVDGSGNVYTTGSFQGTVDFDPGVGVVNLISPGGIQESFISKLDSNGNYVWAKGLSGTGVSNATGISLDSSGNIYTTGAFNGTVNFGPGSGVASLSSAGSFDSFVSKLDSSGNYVWAKRLGGVSSDGANGIAVDSSGNVYTTGTFTGPADFDPGVGVANLTIGTGFVSKLFQANGAPVVTVSAPALAYTENSPALLLDSTIGVTDPDSANFNTGSLSVNYTLGGTVNDRLALRNQGLGAGQIGISGSTVTFGGVAIGSFTGGVGTTPLVISFNANATPIAAQALLRNLTYANVSDAPSPAARTVQFILTDGAGGTSAAVTKTINFTAINDAPTIVAPVNVTVLEDVATALTGISFADLDAGAAIVSASFSVPAGTLAAIASGGVTVTGTPSNLTLSGTIAQLNAFIAASNLTYKTLLNSNASLALGVSLTDNGNSPGPAQTASSSVAIVITSVNNAPSFSAINPPSSLEDGGLQTINSWVTFNPGAPNETGQTPTYTVSNLSNPGLFALAPSLDSSGTLTYTAAPNAFGTATFDLVVQDNGGFANGGLNTSAPQSFILTVNSVNDQPSFTAANPAAVNEDAGAQTLTNWVTFNPGPADEAAQTATYTISNISNPSLFAIAPTIAPNGTLTYTPAANAFGTTTFDALVQDSGGTANGGNDTSLVQSFTLTINPVNDAPSFTPGANQTALEGSGAQTVPNWVAAFNPGPTNESGQAALTYTVVNVSDPSLFTAIGQPTIAPDGTLTYTPTSALSSAQTATIVVQVQDNGSTANGGIDTSATQSFTITINPIVGPPPAAIPIFTVFQLQQTFTLNRATQKLLAAQPPGLEQLFDEEYYLSKNPDVAAAVGKGVFQSGFQHFVTYGEFEGRNPSALYSEQYYLSQNADVAAAVAQGNFHCGLQHFLQYGQFEGRNPSTLYNEQSYLSQNQDVAAAVAHGSFRSGFQHFLQYGFAEARLPNLTLFNEFYYLQHNPDVAAAVAHGQFKNGLQHFEQCGQHEGRQPSLLFNEQYYLSQNPDVASAVAHGQFKSGFAHYLNYGRFEGRQGVGLID